jgi:predicted sugar kinase
MIPHQLFIGSVAMVLGALALGASLANYNGLFQLAKMRMLEETVGRGGARLACGLLGCGLIVVGGLIVTGVLPRKTAQRFRRADPQAASYGRAAVANWIFSNPITRDRS